MERQDYHSSITVNTSIGKAFESIQKRVNEWWTPNLKGDSEKPGDEFTVRFGETAVMFTITESDINKKIVWLVTKSHLPWLEDKNEWTGTSIIWEFQVKEGAAQISLTHVGLVPEAECYDTCEKGWDFFFKESLYKLLTENKGLPDTARGERCYNMI